HGSMGGGFLNQPMVGIAQTPTGRGYWTVASDGGVFSFGDARFRGSTGNIRLVSPIVGLEGQEAGYRFVGREGGVFAFGIPFRGSVAGLTSAPVAAIAHD